MFKQLFSLFVPKESAAKQIFDQPNRTARQGLFEIIQGVVNGDPAAIAAAVTCTAIILITLFSIFG